MSGSVIDGTSAGASGGALFLFVNNVNTAVYMTTIIDCSASEGAAIALGSKNQRAQIRNVDFVGNIASQNGGAVLIQDGNTGFSLYGCSRHNITSQLGFSLQM